MKKSWAGVQNGGQFRPIVICKAAVRAALTRLSTAHTAYEYAGNVALTLLGLTFLLR